MKNKKRLPDIMLDLETMGTESFSAIISFAAVEFDLMTGETGKEFYEKICLQSCLDAGLNISANTLNWWMKQEDDARKEFTKGEGITLRKALRRFSSFFHKDYKVWGNSVKFDCGILGDAYKVMGKKPPWRYTNERCVRTLANLKPEIKANYPSVGTAHNAKSDCYFQIGYCHETWKALNT